MILLALAGLAVLFWPKVLEAVEKIRGRAPGLEPRHMAGAAMVAAAVLVWATSGGREAGPTPVPDAGPVSFKGLFTGPTASEDAALVGALCTEIGDEIAYDQSQPQPYLTTGVAIDELRKSARILRCRGISIGDRQPLARDAIAKYLDEKVGADGGPLTPQSRAAWVAAYRELGRAITDAAK